jgi:putative zinc finger protein
MKMLTCAATRRRLQAYHDEELTLGEQVAVAAHLEWCDGCAGILAELRQLRDALRGSLPGRSAVAPEHELDLREAVINRLRAEDTLSFGAWIRESFDDMHFVYAGVSAMAAALVCIVVTFGMMRFATNEAPDSPAALVKLLNTPGSNLNPVSVSPFVILPRALDEEMWEPAGAESTDAELMLSAIVTREGRVGNLEVLNASSVRWISMGQQEAKAVENLLDVASRARFEPASLAGAPVAVNMVWIVAHTTVRAPKGPLDPALRIGKKSASLHQLAAVHV